MSDSCVAVQEARRASKGCALSSWAGAAGLLEVEEMGEGPTPRRRVSWRPGAEGAECEVVVWVLEWLELGAMRIAMTGNLILVDRVLTEIQCLKM